MDWTRPVHFILIMNNLSSVPLGIYEKGIPLQFDWETKFKIAKDAGFDFIEFSIDGLKPRIDRLSQSNDDFYSIKKISQKFDMPFQTMALTANRYFPLGDEQLAEKGKEIVKRAIEIAEILGIKIIQIAAYDVNGPQSDESTQKRFLSNLVDLAKIAADKKIILAPEVLEDVPFFNSVQKAVKIIKKLNVSNIKLYADCGNTASIGIDAANDLSFDNGYVVATHIKDALIDNCRNVPYGKGIVDFQKVFNHFKNTNYQGLFVAEVWSDEDPAFVPTLTDVSSFIRKYLDSK